MRVLHACWNLDGKLIIWGESKEKFLSTAKDRSSVGDLHPFCLGHDQLVNDLDSLEFDPDEKGLSSVCLPSKLNLPLPSPELNSEESYEDGQINRWKIECLELEPLSTVAFLTSIPDELPEDIRLGDSFSFWVESSKLLLDLLAHGRFLPLLSRQGGNYRARWQVILNEERDQERLATLIKSMPSLCRNDFSDSLNSTDDKDLVPNQISSALILESFLSHCGDHLIRMFLKSRDLLPEIIANSPKFGAETAWLEALTRDNSQLDSSAQDLLRLEERLKHWSGKFLAGGAISRFKTGFRVVAPEDVPDKFEEASWKIEILLTSTGEKNNFITASDYWIGKLGFLSQSDLNHEEIEELLLRELGEAQENFEGLKQALFETCPEGIELSTNDAWIFLKEVAPELEKNGYPVVTPSWWGESVGQLGLHLHVDSESQDPGAGTGMLGMGQLLDFSWSLSMGDEVISQDEFKKLVDQQSNLVYIGNQWVEIDSSKLDGTFKFLEAQKKNNKMQLIDALRFGFGVNQGDETLPVTGFSSTGWVGNLLQSESRSIILDRKLDNFKGELRPYQQQGLSWLYFLTRVGIGGCLADDMGLGKTIQFLALLQLEREAAREASDGKFKILPTLLIVPMSILDNWYREANKFAPELNVYIHHGPSRLTGNSLKNQIENSDLVLTTYSLSHRDESVINSFSWGRIALDEAQNIKNVSTKQSKAIRNLVESQLMEDRQDSSPCHRIALTGTPLENHLDELWSIFDFLNPGFLGKLSEFRSRFTLPIERHRDTSASEGLGRLVKPFLLRRLKTQPEILSDLPEKIEMEVITALTSEQASLYQGVVDDMLPEVSRLDGMHRKGLVLSSLTRLKQICNHPTLYLKDNSQLADRSGKLNRLEELLEVILAEDDKTLIFTQYAQMGFLLQDHLSKKFSQEVLFLHGSLSKKKRMNLIDSFQKPDGPKIFILSLKAGGFGLNLTEANQVIHYDQWWNPAVEDQATDRAHRIGQKKNVQVRKFICKGTLEEKIASLLARKKDLADSIVGSARNTITEMSVDDLRDLLQLSTGGEKKSSKGGSPDEPPFMEMSK